MNRRRRRYSKKLQSFNFERVTETGHLSSKTNVQKWLKSFLKILEFSLAYCALVISIDSLHDSHRQQNLDKLYENILMDLAVKGKYSRQVKSIIENEELLNIENIFIDDRDIQYFESRHNIISEIYVNEKNIHKAAVEKLLSDSEKFSELSKDIINNIRVTNTYEMLIRENFQVEKSRRVLSRLKSERTKLIEEYKSLDWYKYPDYHTALLHTYYKEEMADINRIKWFILF